MKKAKDDASVPIGHQKTSEGGGTVKDLPID